MLGGLYGSLCVIPGLTFLCRTLWRIIVLGLMGWIAFDFNKDLLRRCVLFVLLSMALGGIAIGIGKGGFISIILSTGLICLMCIFGLRGHHGSRYLPIEINDHGKRIQFTALIDTGNMLIDPLTGQNVIVVSPEIGEQLLMQDINIISDPVSAVEHIAGSRLIPFSSVGTENGLLIAKYFEDVKVGKWHGKCLVAFSPHKIGRNEAYEALTGGI